MTTVQCTVTPHTTVSDSRHDTYWILARAQLQLITWSTQSTGICNVLHMQISKVTTTGLVPRLR